MLGSTTFFICAIIAQTIYIYIYTYIFQLLLNKWQQLCSAPITYTVNTGNPKAETTFGVEACNIIWVSEVDLWEVLLLGSNFTFQYAISFGNTEMKFIANIDSKKHINYTHYICWLVKLIHWLVSRLFPVRPHSLQGIVCGFKYNETIQSKPLLSDAYFAGNIINEI